MVLRASERVSLPAASKSLSEFVTCCSDTQVRAHGALAAAVVSPMPDTWSSSYRDLESALGYLLLPLVHTQGLPKEVTSPVSRDTQSCPQSL